MKTTKLTLVLAAIALLLAVPNLAWAQAGVPTTISYQGRVTVEGQPFHHTGHFKFAIVDGEGRSVWSNDGTSADGAQPAATVQLEVANGLFNVLLGDDTIMTALNADVFAQAETYLRVWFSATGGSFIQLPDRPIAAVPYALNADTVDGLQGIDLAAAGHDHWNQFWSGDGMGLVVTSNNNIGVEGASAGTYTKLFIGETISPGVLGTATATTGKAVGVHGRSYSTDAGIGVYGTAALTGTVGIATATGGRTRGVYGESASPLGAGLYGNNVATTGGGAGVVGESDSPMGAGLSGYGDHQSGENYGVYAQTSSSAGKAVYGLALAGNGTTYGVYGKASSLSGRGVYAEGGYYGVYAKGTDPSGISYGVYGETPSTASNATGVYGKATASQGSVYGIRGEATSAGAGVGVQGKGTQAGVHGIGTSTGETNGVLGETGSSQGAGVHGVGSVTGIKGVATHASGTTYGVRGESNSAVGYGVYSKGNAHVEGDLSVTGELSVGGDVSWGARRSYLAIPAAAFQPSGNGLGFENDGFAVQATSGGVAWMVAPVNFPHGATVTRMVFYWRDIDETQDATLWLYRYDPLDQPGPGEDLDQMAVASSTGASGGWQFSSDDSIAFQVVDNSGYMYYLALEPVRHTFHLLGVRLDYTITGPY